MPVTVIRSLEKFLEIIANLEFEAKEHLVFAHSIVIVSSKVCTSHSAPLCNTHYLPTSFLKRPAAVFSLGSGHASAASST